MSRIVCVCENVIRDGPFPSETSGYIRRDVDVEPARIEAARKIVSFFDARDRGDRDEWLRSRMNMKRPDWMEDSDVVVIIVETYLNREDSSISECSSCGRVYLSRKLPGGEWETLPFSPDCGVYTGVLSSRSNPYEGG